jgi:LPS-assembly protein
VKGLKQEWETRLANDLNSHRIGAGGLSRFSEVDLNGLRRGSMIGNIAYDSQTPLGQRDFVILGPELDQIEHGGTRNGTAIGDIGKRARLLQELHHFQFRSHKTISAETIAVRVPRGLIDTSVHLDRLSARKSFGFSEKNGGITRNPAWQLALLLVSCARLMIQLRPTFALAAIFLATGLSLLAQEQPAWEVNALTEKGGAVYDFKTGITSATNGVIVKRGNAVLVANQVTVWHQSGEAFAVGDVRIEQGDQTWVGDSMRYNFNTHRMEGKEFRTGLPPVFISGHDLSGDLTGKIYTATNAYFTTDDVPEPGHRLRASRIRLVPGQYVEAWNAFIYLRGVPVFYFPYYRRNLGPHANNLNFMPGFRNKWGPFILTSYVWYLNDELDGTMHVDYRAERGVGLGPDLNFHLGRWGNGSLNMYYLNDQAPGSGIQTDRGRLHFSYLAEPFTNLTVRSVVRYESDQKLLRDFFESEYRSNPQQPTFLEVNKTWENFSLDTMVNGRVNDFFETVDRLPEVKLTGFRQQVFSLPVYYDSESSLGFYRHMFADTNGPVMPYYEAVRGDTFHQLTVPIGLFGWLNLTPRVGARYTYYGDDSGPGESHTAQSRFVFNTGAELTFKASHVWSLMRNHLFDLDGIRHIVEPSANYVFVPTPNVGPSEIPQFDSELPSLVLLPIEYPDYNAIDSVDSQNVIRWGLRNRLQTKRLGRVVDFLDWQLFTDWRINPKHGQKTFSDLYSDLTWRPRSWLTLESRVRVDINSGDLTMAFHTLMFQPNDHWSWTLGHYYLHDDFSSPLQTALGQGNNLFTSALFYRPTENWSYGAIHRFEITTGRLEEQQYAVYRDFRSWVGALIFRVRDSQGGSDDFTIAFTFSLKAMANSSPINHPEIF